MQRQMQAGILFKLRSQQLPDDLETKSNCLK